jgi:cytolysin (calcineurin-like family phosphatase)
MASFPERSTAQSSGSFSLLVAFTFSGVAERYDHRRQLIAEETNNIGTAWLRVDLLSTSDQPPVRELFRRYLDSRLQT